MSLFISLIGFIGVAGVGSFVAWIRRYVYSRGLFRFTSNEPLDIVVATSDVSRGRTGAGSHLRATVSASNLAAAVNVATTSGALRQNKVPRVSLSKKVQGLPQGDVVIIGGQIKNEVAADYFEKFNQTNPYLCVDRDLTSEGDYFVSVGDWKHRVKAQNQAGTDLPSNDTVLVIFGRNVLTENTRRAILCAGFTSHGSIAGIDFVFDRGWKKHATGSFWPRLFTKRWFCYLAVLDVQILNDVPTIASTLLWKEFS